MLVLGSTSRPWTSIGIGDSDTRGIGALTGELEREREPDLEAETERSGLDELNEPMAGLENGESPMDA